MPIELVLLGAGGHAKVVYEAVLRGRQADRIRVMDENSSLDRTAFFDLRVAAPLGDWAQLPERVHVCIGQNEARRRLGLTALDKGKTLFAIVHPAAMVSPTARVEAGVFIAAGAIVGPSAAIGTCTIINHGAVVDHDCGVGKYAHVGPHATLGGGVQVGDGALIGASAVVLPGVRLGQSCVVGAGAVVTRDVADGQTVVGVPAASILTTTLT